METAVSNMFSHGRLRLYLLRLLAEQPRHGYELIRLLEDRFMGLYQPSAGTIYPRLARMEADGLVTHSQQGRLKVYAITDRGRAELARRSGELAELEGDIRDSLRDVAAEVKSAARDLRDEVRQAARDLRRRHQFGAPKEWNGAAWAADAGPIADRLVPRIQELLIQVVATARAAKPTDAQLRECMSVLEEAFGRIRTILREPRGPAIAPEPRNAP
jgi:DNA-binding PadR family transcriptional regulator